MLEELDNFAVTYHNKQLEESVKTTNKECNSAEEYFFKKLENLGINLDELKLVLQTKGNALINSCAGSGKTTALVLKIIYDLLTGETMKTVYTNDTVGYNGEIQRGEPYKVPKKIFVSTFLKTGAEEIKIAFNEWCKRLGLNGISADILTIKTMHSEFYDVIKGVYGKVNLTENTSKYVREIMLENKIRSRTAYSKTLTIDEVKDMECILTYARNRLDNAKYKHPLLSDYGLIEQTLNYLLQQFQNKKQVNGGELDFEDLQELLYNGIQKNDNLRKYLASRYEVIYLDEFQDTAQIQYGLLKAYFDGADKVVVVGDEDQCIYAWRGSDVSIITEKFEQDYKPTVLSLTTNYRCSANILNPITTSISKNSNRHEKVLKANKSGGEVRIIYGKSVTSLLDNIYEDIQAGKSVGVLSRTNYDLLVPAMILELEGTLRFKTSKQMTLDNRMANQVCGIIDLVNKRYTAEFPNYFSLFLNRYEKYEAEMLCQILAANPMQTIYTIPEEDLRYSLDTLCDFIMQLRKVKETKGDVAAYRFILVQLKQVAFAGDSQYATRARDLVNFVLNLLDESEIMKDKSINEIDRILNEVLPQRLRNRTKYQGEVDITLSTVHEAKGKEWDSVYIWNDVDGVFPASVGKHTMTLAEHEEERRVHYIAWTRPKEKLTVYTSMGRESPFLLECTLGEGCKTIKNDYVAETTEDGKTLSLEKEVVKMQDTNESDTEFIIRYISDKKEMDDDSADNIRKLLMRMAVDKVVEQLNSYMNKVKEIPDYKLSDDGRLTYLNLDDALNLWLRAKNLQEI